MKTHATHCDCAAYLRGVLHNLKRTGCSCDALGAGAALPPDARCDNCKIVDRALHKTRGAQLRPPCRTGPRLPVAGSDAENQSSAPATPGAGRRQ